MADDNRGGNPEPESGDLIRRGEPLPPAPARTAKERTLGRLLSMLSIWPFRNKAFAKSLETAQEVVEKQNKLEETIIQHGRTRGRLNDLELTLAQDRLQRQREFLEEQNRLSATLNDTMLEGDMMKKKNKMKKGELTIQEIEQKKRLLQAKKELEVLQQPPPPPPPPRPPGRGQSEKQKRRKQAIKRYNREIQRIEAMTVTDKQKGI
jgi:hypothetical protein